jgi:hypothetical protein
LIPELREALEPILTPADALDFERLAGLDIVLPADLRGKNYLTLCSDGGLHDAAHDPVPPYGIA